MSADTWLMVGMIAGVGIWLGVGIVRGLWDGRGRG